MVDRKKTLYRLACIAAAANIFFTCESVPDYCPSTGLWYDPTCEFCFGGKKVTRCDNDRGQYNPLTQGCDESGNIGTRCANETVAVSGTPCGGFTIFVGTAPENGGTVTGNHQSKAGFNYGDPVTMAAVQAEGYRFIGWAGSGSENASGNSLALTMNAHKSLIAIFGSGSSAAALTAAAFPREGGTVQIAGGPAGPEVTTSEYADGASVTVKAEPARGYKFKSWAGASTSASKETTVTMGGGKTMVAIFEPNAYKLTVNVTPKEGGAVYINSGALEAGKPLNDTGATIEALARPAPGYTFAGWSGALTGANHLETIYVDSSDITITANFQKGGSAVQTTYDLHVAVKDGGGTVYVNSTDTVRSGSTGTTTHNAYAKVNVTAAPDAGYSFVGWEDGAGEAISGGRFIQILMDGDKGVTAVFVATDVPPVTPTTFTVTFMADGGIPAPPVQTVASGGTATSPAAMTRTGYTFGGWYREATFATEWNFDVNTVTATTTLYAKWTAVSVTPPTTFTVTFNSGEGGSTVAPLTIASGGTATKPTPDPTRAGYTFGGWYKEAAFATEWDFATDEVIANVTLYAKWTAVPVTPTTFTVTFMADGGTPAPPVQTVASGGTATSPAAMTRTGFTFGGWYSNSGLTMAWDFDMNTVTANTTLYAKWTAVPVTPTTFQFTDERDGKTYEAVKIGNQTWMAENLNYETANSWCYDEPANCAIYGRLYTWSAAMGACPDGWELPDTADWNKLVNYAGGASTAGKKLKAKSGWNNRINTTSGNGTDDYGFSALPGGGRNIDGVGGFRNAGNVGYWWSATAYGSDYAYRRDMSYGYDSVFADPYTLSTGYSVRCVSDSQ